jgi:eukaryotic-like serine/threonine-protein kinase
VEYRSGLLNRSNQPRQSVVKWPESCRRELPLSSQPAHIDFLRTRQTTLLSDPSETIGSSSVCAGGGPILFGTYLREGKTATNVWRMDPDGNNPQQLTTGKGDANPVCLPDGRSFYYYDRVTLRMMKMPVAGGSAELVKASIVPNGWMQGGVNFSPDGRWLPEIEVKMDVASGSNARRIALLDVAANAAAPAKYFDPRPDIQFPIAFTPDGKSLAYNTGENGVGNLWVQPLDGSPGHRLTGFTSDRILWFQFSRDGKPLAIARMHRVSDVVLLRDARAASASSNDR